MKECAENKDSLTEGFLFNRSDNYRDVMYKGDCDDAVEELARLLGFVTKKDYSKVPFLFVAAQVIPRTLPQMVGGVEKAVRKF